MSSRCSIFLRLTIDAGRPANHCLSWNEKRISRQAPSDVAVNFRVLLNHWREIVIGTDGPELRSIDIGPRGRSPDTVLRRIGKSSSRRTACFTIEHLRWIGRHTVEQEIKGSKSIVRHAVRQSLQYVALHVPCEHPMYFTRGYTVTKWRELFNDSIIRSVVFSFFPVLRLCFFLFLMMISNRLVLFIEFLLLNARSRLSSSLSRH